MTAQQETQRPLPRLVKQEALPANSLQRAIQAAVPRPLSQQELQESERNLVGLFSVLLRIHGRNA